MKPSVCRYCKHRFYPPLLRYLSHLNNHEKHIKPYWYTNQTLAPKARCVELDSEWRRYTPAERPYSHHQSDNDDILDDDINADKYTDKLQNNMGHMCLYCDKLFSCNADKIAHQRAHHDGQDKPHRCQYCGKGLAHRATRLVHERTHTGEKPFKCQYCAKCFNQSGTKNKHEMIHRGERPHKCQYCEKRFVTKGNRNKHQETHTNNNPRKRRGKHTGEKQHQCQYCQKRFVTIGFRNRHEKTHFKKQDTKSNNLQKITQTEQKPDEIHRIEYNETSDIMVDSPEAEHKNIDRTEHGDVIVYTDMEMHATENDMNHNMTNEATTVSTTTADNKQPPYHCRYCHQVLPPELDKQTHESTHKGELKPYQCRFCRKLFRYFQQRKSHEMIHTGEKPHECKFCKKAFRMISCRNTHERIHTGEKPFPCRYCDKRFNHEGNKLKHESTHEKKPKKMQK